MAAAKRFDDAEIAALFAPLENVPAVALAVSGGPDSLALLLLAARWRDAGVRRPTIEVLTVDHRLRPSSGEESAFVTKCATALGFPTRVLVWDGARPSSGIEAAARAARYRLLGQAMTESGIRHLVLAHHRDDQAETFLLRLTRGSGVHGLAGMRRVSERDGIILVRPFLDLPKSRLAGVVVEAGLTPVDDESNRDERFTRAKWRAVMPELARLGLDAERLAELAQAMAQASDAIDAAASALLAEAVDVDELAIARLETMRFARAPQEIRFRALTRLLSVIGGGIYPPRRERLEALDRAVTAPIDGSGNVGAFRRTLGGVVVERVRNTVFFYRESGRNGLSAVPFVGAFDGLWDKRFRIAARGPADVRFEIGPLGAEARSFAQGKGLPDAFATLPAIRREGELVAVPAFDHRVEREAGLEVRAVCVVGERLFRHSDA